MHLAYLLWERLKRKKVGERGRKKEIENESLGIFYSN